MVAVEGSVPGVYLDSVFCFMPATCRVQNSGFPGPSFTFRLIINASWHVELEALSESDGELEVVSEVLGMCTQGNGSLGKSSTARIHLPWCNHISLAAPHQGFWVDDGNQHHPGEGNRAA